MSEDGELGLVGAASIGLGGMIGGGVFAVLGVVAGITGAAAWAAFTGACVLSSCAAYSFLKLNEIADAQGGSVTLIREAISGEVAGFVGWTLLFGYVGATAMYASAFGSFFTRLAGVETLSLGAVGVPVRPVVSALAVLAFVALNLAGARATGSTETLLVAVKLAVLVGVAGWGLYYGWGADSLEFGLERIRNAEFGIVRALAVSFVSFQGWQLLMYDQDRIADPQSTLPKAVYLSILVTVIVDGMVAVLVTSLAPSQVITAHPELAVAEAVRPFLGNLGFTLISLAALFSTGSAINGTLFSSAHFGKGMLANDLLPDRLGDADADGVPERELVVIGVLAAGFAGYGSLQGITSFGSLAFMLVFGAVCAIAFRQRDHDAINPIVPAVGALGSLALFPVLLYHLAVYEPGTFGTVVLVALVVFGLELGYFEGDRLRDGVDEIEDRV
ncbi:APC family permease [Halolamina sp. C58]|uniref:APC family permease n=1 Tax=Halolamina sp. C58 TaxID=3421640 RepID=UPI003EBFC022